MTTYDIIWDDKFLPLYGSSITIPASTLLWRGFDPAYPSISDRPAYYGHRKYAEGYAKKYGTNASSFITTRKINLLDIRYMKVLLKQLFDYNKITNNDKEVIMATTISFGLCSLSHQIALFKERYHAIYLTTDPMFDALKMGIRHVESLLKPTSVHEQSGIRIAETTNDAFVMGFLKELFFDHYDGFISPDIESPFHIEKKGFTLNAEIIIFNPYYSGIRLLQTIPKTLTPITINGLVLQSGYEYSSIITNEMKTSYYAPMKGGASSELPNDYNHFIEKGDVHIISLYRKGIAAGKRWNRLKQVKLYGVVPPHPMVDPSIFVHHDLIKDSSK
jgi:hypothetical protein